MCYEQDCIFSPLLKRFLFLLVVVTVSLVVIKVCIFCGSQYGMPVLSSLSNRLMLIGLVSDFYRSQSVNYILYVNHCIKAY